VDFAGNKSEPIGAELADERIADGLRQYAASYLVGDSAGAYRHPFV
jgi:hypothetical protein